MKLNDTNEPSLEQMDDYYNLESNKKRRTIYLIIVALLAVGVVFSFIKSSNSNTDYIGTSTKPGINTVKNY